MLLSILIGGKNDNYDADVNGNGGVCKRLELTLNKTLDNLNRLGASDIEVVVCDWGSDVKISEALVKERHPQMKFVYVSPDIAKKYNNGSSYSIVHPFNVAFRQSTGRYVVFWDSDCFMPYEHFEKVYRFAQKMSDTKDDKFYWGSRYHIPRVGYANAKDYRDVDTFLKTCTLYPSASNTSESVILRHDKINKENFVGCAMALMMPRWMGEESTCWWEELQFWGWQDIELHYRLSSRYFFGGDLEDMGLCFFHLDHHENWNRPFVNPQKMPTRFQVNAQNWGLSDENLEITT